MVNLDSEYEAKKSALRDEYRAKQLEIVKKIREARRAAATGQKEFEGEPVGLKIVSLSNEYDRIESERGTELRKLDAEKRRLADERTRKHPWSF